MTFQQRARLAENLQSLVARHARTLRGCGRSSKFKVRSSKRPERKGKEKAARRRSCFGPDRAAMPMHQALHRRQTDPLPGKLLVVMQTLKHPEEPARVFGFKADAIVAHLINAASVLRAPGDLNGGTRLTLGEFDGVAAAIPPGSRPANPGRPRLGQFVNAKLCRRASALSCSAFWRPAAAGQ